MNKRSFLFMFVMTTAFLILNNFIFDKRPSKAENQQEVVIKKVDSPERHVSIEHRNEDFYVLQNDKQQIVFSTLGGAISEINLGVSDNGQKEGKIETIAIDNEIAEKAPQNAYFPNFSYHIIDDTGTDVVKEPSFGGHTPLLRRSLKDSDGKVIFQMPSSLYATSLIDENSTSTTTYKVHNFTKNSIEFIGKEKDRTIHKTYKLIDDAAYALELEVQVTGETTGLWISSGVTEVDLVNGIYSPILQYLSKDGKKQKVKKIGLPKSLISYDSLRPVWSGISNGYFGIIIDPLSSQTMGLKADKINGEHALTRLSAIDPEFNTYPASKYPGYEILTPYKASSKAMKYVVYAGPFDKKTLASVDAFLAVSGSSSDQLSDATSYTSWISTIAEPFAKLLSIFLNWFHALTNSWGISIILLTIVLRLIIYPLNQWALRSQKRLKEIAPQKKAIEDKYKGDPKRIQMELAMLFRNEKVNPFMGCLPSILQLPFVFGMYQLLQSSYALRGASFIPGWINNLSAPDTLFSWSTPIIFFGTSFHLLPFILGGLTFVQGKMNTWMQKEKGELTDQEKQMNSMTKILPFVMMFIFYNMASGLNIYWIFSSLFGIVQQWLVMRSSTKPKKTKRAR